MQQWNTTNTVNSVLSQCTNTLGIGIGQPAERLQHLSLWNLSKTDKYILLISPLYDTSHRGPTSTQSHTCDHESLSIATETVLEKPRQHRVTVRDVRVSLTAWSPVAAVASFNIDAAATRPWRCFPGLHDRPLSWFINTAQLVITSPITMTAWCSL